MGFFDDFLKTVDKGLKAVEEGALEERLNKFADTLDKTVTKAEKGLGAAAEKPQQLLKAAEQKQDAVQAKAADIRNHVAKNIDIIQKKD